VNTGHPSASRIVIGTRETRFWFAIGVVLLAALLILPAFAGRSLLQDLFLLFTLIALAQFWNLLAGYAGLVSVGQQAYVGLGAYAFFYLTGALNVNVYVALALAGPFAGLMAIPASGIAASGCTPASIASANST